MPICLITSFLRRFTLAVTDSGVCGICSLIYCIICKGFKPHKPVRVVNSVKLTVDTENYYNGYMEPLGHPEAQQGEVFFTNATARQFKMMRWQTKRRGRVAYDGEGNRLDYKNWYPVFLHKEELDNVKADLIVERKTWRQVMSQLNLDPNF